MKQSMKESMKQLLGKEENPLLKSTFKSAVCVALGLSFAPNGAPTASAQIVTNASFSGNAAAFLDLDPVRTLAAINFYDTGFGSGPNTGSNYTVGTIKGKEFFNYDLHLVEPAGGLNNTAFNIGTGVYAGAGFTFTHNHINNGDPSRHFTTGLVGPAPAQSQIGLFDPQDADNIEAERLAQASLHINSSGTVNDMFFDFGATHANKPVEISVIGGGIWDHLPTHQTGIRFDVGGEDKAEILETGFHFDIATFKAELDGEGKLQLGLTRFQVGANTRWVLIGGITVTEVGPTARFEITDIDYDAAAGTANVTWNSKPGRSYRVEWSNDLAPGGWNEDDDSVPASVAPATTTSYLFEGIPANTPMRFFRVWEQ